ncbi:IclR family transcriptional regulator [Micromonospora globispora]|uniref:IclR family transcriptional regulator n=1 Tax=Micromonospora globispora TaxID=1450148 RepID=UPI001C8AE10D|nr:helix-turn-helix domain-containing protein [Micromonospora globispora]
MTWEFAAIGRTSATGAAVKVRGMTSQTQPPEPKIIGSQTLARGLRALEYVATSTHGVTVQDVSAELGVHRTIAYRLLATLAEFRLIARSADGRFRAGSGLTALAQGVQRGLRDLAEPLLRRLSREAEATVALLVEEGDEAVAVLVVEPPTTSYHLTFRTGSRHPIERGAAGVALLAGRPATLGEPESVSLARGRGYAMTHGEVEPGAYGVAAPLRRVEGTPGSCVNIITNRRDVAERAIPVLLEVVRSLDAALV